MRASATSRISHAHAAHQPSQGANANKADDTSPFALLLASTASAKDVKGGKNPAQDKDAQDDTSAAKLPAATNTNDAPADTASAQTQQIPAQADAKPVKADSKQDDDIKTDETVTADPAAVDPSVLPQVVIAAAQQQAALAQTVQPQTAATPTGQAGDETVDAVVAANGSNQAAQAQAQAPAPTAAAAADEGAAEKNTGADVESATAPTPLDTVAQPKPAANAKSDAVASAKPDAATGKPGATAANINAAPAKPDAKPDTKSDAKAAPKTAANKSDDRKAKADDSQPAEQSAANADALPPPAAGDKPAAAAPNNAITAPTLAATVAPQGTAPASAPTLTQHVQVTAQAQPNMPALAVEIATKSQAGSKQFDIRLDPPELGRVEVRLSIDATGKASAHLTADQPQTLDLLQKDASSLTRALRDAGLDVNQNGLNFSLRQQAGDTHQGQNGGGRSSARRGQMLSASKSIDATQASAAYRAPADGRLDIKV